MDAVGLSGEPTPRDVRRFITKVKQDSRTGCWVWTAHKDYKGYGQFRLWGGVRRAPRAAYAIFRGPIPDGATVNHVDRCRNPECVNPAHLELLGHSENTADGNRHRHDDEEVPF